MKHFEQRPIIRFFKLFCPKSLQEAILGDLEEQYEMNRSSRSRLLASFLLSYNVLRFLRYGILKRNQSSRIHYSFPIRSFMKVFFRSTKRNISFYSINVIGVVISLTVALFILTYVKNETTYDHFHKNADNIYRIVGKRIYGAWFPHISLKHSTPIKNQDFSWATKVSRLSRVPDRYVTVGENRFSESKALVLESGDPFFDLFDFRLKSGVTSDEATKVNNTVILTQESASRFFGQENPIGKPIYFDSVQVVVSGVMESLPTNTHFDFNMLLVNNEYFSTKASAFIYFEKNATPKEKILNDIMAYAQNVEGRKTLVEADLQNIKDIHLGSNLTFEMKPGGNEEQLSIFILIAVIVLIISSANFANISAAIFAKRRKEIAVRKVLGSRKSSLSFQFLFESILLASFTIPVVFILSFYLLPYFNDFTGINFSPRHLLAPEMVMLTFGVAFLVGFLGGIYPSVVMPQINVLALFKNHTRPGKLHIRKLLVTFQFALLVGLGTASFFVNQQMHHISNLKTGFKKEGLLKIKRAWDIEGAEKIRAFKNDLASQAFILSVSEGQVPGDEDYPMKYKAEGVDDLFEDALSIPTDPNYLKTLQIKKMYGPYFNEEQHPNLSLLVNDSFVRKMNWDDPIGKKINANPTSENPKWIPVRGVFEDFNFFSLHQEVSPIFLFIRNEREYMNRNVLVRINLEKSKEAFEWIEKVWNDYMPDTPLDYAFVEDDIQSAYVNDQKTANISTVLSVIAMLIAILGLIGMTSYMTTLKVKEIGVRKVLGASSWHLLIHFNKEYVLLILISTVGASSLSVYFLKNWIQDYAYQIDMNLIYFALAGVFLFLITFSTVSVEALKVIRRNPINALRQE
ncbi:FtsX-like permease family protein [Ekhidna sp.]|uniref:FtsX-like permease family protein n=1 Tax=Ekhidna sp. TaxID=2608089 RepID=UPI003CCB84E2